MTAALKLTPSERPSGGAPLLPMGRQTRLGERTRSQNTAWWMVVLGDLLTLLVCFSVAIIISTREANPNHINLLVRSELPQSVQPEPGTKLALGTGSGAPLAPGEWFHMSESSVIEGSFMALDEWLGTLGGTEQLVVEVLACGTAAETRYQMELVARIQGALGVTQGLRFSEVGIGCDELRARVPGNLPEIAVLVRLIRKSHG